jgi:hypothetical protein
MAVQPYFETKSDDDSVPLSDAAQSTLVAAEQLVKDWLALARLQATETARSGAIAAGLFAGAALLALLAWVGASVAAGFLLARWLPADASTAIVAAGNAVLAGGLVAGALRRGRARNES